MFEIKSSSGPSAISTRDPESLRVVKLSPLAYTAGPPVCFSTFPGSRYSHAIVDMRKDYYTLSQSLSQRNRDFYQAPGISLFLAVDILISPATSQNSERYMRHGHDNTSLSFGWNKSLPWVKIVSNARILRFYRTLVNTVTKSPYP